MTLGVLAISIPLTTRYLGQERYGVWVTISSLFALLLVSDLGVSSALVLALAETEAREDDRSSRELVATAFWSLAGVATFVAVVTAAVFPFVSWRAVFNTSAAVATPELGNAAGAAIAIFILSIPLTLVPAIYQALQKTYIANAWVIAASVVSLVALLLVIRSHGGLLALVIAFSGSRLLMSVASTAYLFVRKRPALRPSPRAVSRHAFRRLRALGSKYLVVRSAEMGMFQSHPIIVAQVLGAAQVGVFYVAYRLLDLPSLIVGLLVNPLLPAYADARARGDWRWIWRTLGVTWAVAALFTVLLAGALLLSADFIISNWAGAALVPPRALLFWLVAYGVVDGIVTPVPVLLYGSERVGSQAVIAVSHALVTIVFGVILTHLYGLAGMAIAMTAAMALINLPGQMVELRRLRLAHGPAGGA
jgi:O-antigen/teichoic acid export membrane protein